MKLREKSSNLLRAGNELFPEDAEGDGNTVTVTGLWLPWFLTGNWAECVPNKINNYEPTTQQQLLWGFFSPKNIKKNENKKTFMVRGSRVVDRAVQAEPSLVPQQGYVS